MKKTPSSFSVQLKNTNSNKLSGQLKCPISSRINDENKEL